MYFELVKLIYLRVCILEENSFTMLLKTYLFSCLALFSFLSPSTCIPIVSSYPVLSIRLWCLGLPSGRSAPFLSISLRSTEASYKTDLYRLHCCDWWVCSIVWHSLLATLSLFWGILLWSLGYECFVFFSGQYQCTSHVYMSGIFVPMTGIQ